MFCIFASSIGVAIQLEGRDLTVLRADHGFLAREKSSQRKDGSEHWQQDMLEDGEVAGNRAFPPQLALQRTKLGQPVVCWRHDVTYFSTSEVHRTFSHVERTQVRLPRPRD